MAMEPTERMRKHRANLKAQFLSTRGKPLVAVAGGDVASLTAEAANIVKAFRAGEPDAQEKAAAHLKKWQGFMRMLGTLQGIEEGLWREWGAKNWPEGTEPEVDVLDYGDELEAKFKAIIEKLGAK